MCALSLSLSSFVQFTLFRHRICIECDFSPKIPWSFQLHIYLLIPLLLKHAIVEFMSGRNNNGIDYITTEYRISNIRMWKTLAQFSLSLTSLVLPFLCARLNFVYASIFIVMFFRFMARTIAILTWLNESENQITGIHLWRMPNVAIHQSCMRIAIALLVQSSEITQWRRFRILNLIS